MIRVAPSMAVVAVVQGVGCNHGPSEDGLVFETENLTVRNRTGGELCLGTVELLDREFIRVSRLQGIETPPRLPITLEFGAMAVEDRCAASADVGVVAGCVVSANGEVGIATGLAAAPHELVHASRRAAGISGNPFVEEGLAEALRGGELTGYAIATDAAADPLSPVQLADQFEYSVASYITAGHFLSWLRSDVGDETFFNAVTAPGYRDNSETLAGWFQSEFDLSFDDATQLWRNESDLAYWQRGPCESPRSLGGGIMVDGELDCSSGSTLGASDVEGSVIFSPQLCIDVAPATQLELRVEASESVTASFVGLDDNGVLRGTSEVAGGDTLLMDADAPWLVVSVRTVQEETQTYRFEIRPID